MDLLMEAMRSLGAVLLQVVAALLLEELTFGGLVRLFVAPRPGAGKCGALSDRSSSLGCNGGARSDRSLSLRRKIREHKQRRGEGQ
jgi:hypothetical protein